METVSCPESSSCHGPQLGTCHKDILSVYLSAVFMYLVSSGCVAAEGRPPPADCHILVLVTTVPSPEIHTTHDHLITHMTAISHHFYPRHALQHCSIAVLQPGPVQLGRVVLPRTVDWVHCCDESCSSSSFPRHNP